MKKGLISILLAGALFIFLPLNKENKKESANIYGNLEYLTLRKKEPVIKTPKEDKLSRDIEKSPSQYKEKDYIKIIANEQDRKDEEYLYENTRNLPILKNERKLKDSIVYFLENVSHTYREDRPVNEHYSQIENLSSKQKKAVYLMLGSLKDSSFANNIGKIIYENIKESYLEKGGIIDFKEEGKINLRCIESAGKRYKRAINDTNYHYDQGYSVTEKAYLSRKIGYFHLHAEKYNERKFSGPSTTDEYVIESSLEISNVINEFIITTLKKGEFNMDYTGVDIAKSKKAITIDLGNYSYDTLKVK
jgi:hypothetical protein